MLARYVLADPTTAIPLPERNGRLFSADLGETVDTEQAFYARLIAEGAIVPAEPADQPATAEARPAKRAAKPETDRAE